jgi:hypothetical protein
MPGQMGGSIRSRSGPGRRLQSTGRGTDLESFANLAVTSSPKRTNMTIRLILVLGISAVFCYGCIVPSQESVRNPGMSTQPQSEGKPGKSGSDKGLIKPYIPSERAPLQPVPEQQPEPAASSETSPPAPDLNSRETSEAPVPAPPVEANDKTSSEKGRKWEDQKVKAAATELARGVPGIKKIKICYAVKEDEWWVTLYQESGSGFDLKQYTWNREQDRLEPFLVPKTIPADRLQSQLAEHEPDMACEVLDAGPPER